MKNFKLFLAFAFSLTLPTTTMTAPKAPVKAAPVAAPAPVVAPTISMYSQVCNYAASPFVWVNGKLAAVDAAVTNFAKPYINSVSSAASKRFTAASTMTSDAFTFVATNPVRVALAAAVVGASYYAYTNQKQSKK
ncbi:MAG: hypothetical protein JO129_00200 [Candidatus Dependentiae bacterium]|nr:hypothetical protein [Candidatus Dependentiae bacterium]